MNTVPIGILLQLMACICAAGGLNLQRFAQTPTVRSTKLNVFGVLISVLGGLMEMAAQSFAPQSTLAPLGSSTLVFNLFLAPIVNRDEQITVSDIVASTVIAVGVISVVIASFASPALPIFTGPELADFLTRPQAVTFVVALAVLLLLCLFGIIQVEKRYESYKMGKYGAIYPITSGVQASITVLCAKILGESGKAGGPEEVGFSIFIIAIFAVTLSGIGNMYCMNRGLGRGNDCLVAIPIFAGSAVVFNCVAGAFFWGEFATYKWEQMIAVPFGVFCVLVGVIVLLRKSMLRQKRIISLDTTENLNCSNITQPIHVESDIEEGVSLTSSPVINRMPLRSD
eukprot:g4032.t1